MNVSRRPAHVADIAGADRQSLALMSALQLQPRASWAMLAPVLGTSAATLARRWKWLTDEGLAWLTCSPAFPPARFDASPAVDSFFFSPNGSTVYVELTCKPGARETVIAALVDEPSCWTVACTTGPRDVTVAVTRPSVGELDHFIQQRIGSIPGVTSLQLSPLREFLQVPSNWRIGALSPTQRSAIRALPVRQPRTNRKDGSTSKMDLAVMRELSFDGRASASDIAKRLGLSTSHVNDVIAELLRSGTAEWRVDFAQAHFGWDLMATIALRTPQSRIPDIGAQLRRFSLDVREAVTVVGGANLQVHVWTSQIETVDAVEEMLVTQFPEVTVADRWLTTRFPKRAGVVLDAEGRRRDVIPMISANAANTNSPQSAGEHDHAAHRRTLGATQ